MELVIAVLTGHTEMKWSIGKVISKLVFLKKGAFITGTAGVHLTPICKDT